MSVRRSLLCLALAALLLGGAAASHAKKKKGGNPMEIEDGVLDQIHLSVPAIEGGVPVVIRAFSTEHTDFGTGDQGGKERRKEAADTMRKVAPELLANALKARLDASHAFGTVTVDESGGASAPAEALVISGEFLTINPGSRAKRYFVGFGAGASGVGVSGTVTDASGKTLADFKHLKHSGIGIGGGSYVKFLSDDARDVGSDIGKFLVTWARGGDLTED